MPAVAAVLVLAAAGMGDLTAAEPREPNQWHQVEAGGGGVRRGSAVTWLADEKKFLVVGGVYGNPKKNIPRAYEVQTFDPATARWTEIKPEGLDPKAFPKARSLFTTDKKGTRRLHPELSISSRSVYDPAGRRLYVIDGNDRYAPGKFWTAAYGVASKRWEVLSMRRPPAEADGVMPGEYGPTMAFMEGAALALDPLHHELLLIGGRTGNAPRGFAGHWAFSLAEKKWRPLTAKSETLDPLRAACEAALDPARDGLAALRNVWYAPTDPARDSQALAGRPAKLLKEASDMSRAALAKLRAGLAEGWQALAVAQATDRMAQAAAGLADVAKAAEAGKVDATLLKRLSDAVWAMDAATDLLRAMPGPRMYAAVAYDPSVRGVVVFGGDHGDYLLGDTWAYDCSTQTWGRVFAPTAPSPRRGKFVWLPKAKRLALIGGQTYVPKFIYFRRTWNHLTDLWTFEAGQGRWTQLAAGPADKSEAKDKGKSAPVGPALTCQLAATDSDVIVGLSSAGRWKTTWDATTWLMPVDVTRAAAQPATKLAPAGQRTYLSVVKEYDPCWYDGAERTDGGKTAAWLASLKPNTWTPVPKAARPAPQRDWGTAAFDPDRDQFYHWTGGHMADPASIVSTYHVATNRWSIPYVAEYSGKGIGFRGRPDCMNHTYLNYAYDTLSKKLVCTSLGGTSLYDPDRREFEPRIDQPFRQHPYFTKTVSTPRGVVCWTRGFWGILDTNARAWKKLPVEGKLPRSVHGDENAITYDSKRDVLWLMAADGYQKPNGQIWRYDMKTGQVKPMDPAGMKTVGVKVRPRESVYVPEIDLLVHNAFADNRQIAYDPKANAWVTLNIPKTDKLLGGVSIGLMRDPKRILLWAMASGQHMFVLRIDPAKLRRTPAP